MNYKDYDGGNMEAIGALIVDQQIPSISIDEFQKHFWPSFSGKAPKDISHDMMEVWIHQVAGNPAIPVKVVERDGTLIGKVPPLLSSGGADNLISLYDKIKKAKEMAKLDPFSKQDNSRLIATIELIMDDYQSDYMKDSLQDWINIYRRIEGSVPDLPGEPEQDSSKSHNLSDVVWK